VIDSFSRRVLAWKVSERFEPGNTVEILFDARRNMGAVSTPPTLLTDAGVEHRNARVDEFLYPTFSVSRRATYWE
jgi:transposase InsO family protein